MRGHVDIPRELKGGGRLGRGMLIDFMRNISRNAIVVTPGDYQSARLVISQGFLASF